MWKRFESLLFYTCTGLLGYDIAYSLKNADWGNLVFSALLFVLVTTAYIDILGAYQLTKDASKNGKSK